MAKTVKEKIRCPYCNFDVPVLIKIGRGYRTTTRIVETCDSEMGGCDQEFVIEYSWTPKFDTREIEGYQKIENDAGVNDDDFQF
jgi:hypothetical protein